MNGGDIRRQKAPRIDYEGDERAHDLYICLVLLIATGRLAMGAKSPLVH